MVVNELNTNSVVEKNHENRHHQKSSDFTSSDGRSVHHHHSRSNAVSNDGCQDHRHRTSEKENQQCDKEKEVTNRHLSLVTLNDKNEEEIDKNC